MGEDWRYRMVLTTGGMTSWSYKPVGCNALSSFEQPHEPSAAPEYSPYRPFSQFGQNNPPKLDIPIILMPGQTGEVKNRVIPEHVPLPPDAYISSTEFGFGAAQTHRKYSRTKSPPMTPNSSMRPLNDLYKTRARAPPVPKPPQVFWRSNVRGGGLPSSRGAHRTTSRCWRCWCRVTLYCEGMSQANANWASSSADSSTTRQACSNTE